MKSVFIVLFTLLSTISFGQGSDIERKEIWNEVVIHMRRNELNEIVSTTRFPIKVGENELSEKEFTRLYPSLFDEEILSDFDIGYEELDWVSNETYTFMLISFDEKFDFADLVFKKLNGSWNLVAIELEKL